MESQDEKQNQEQSPQDVDAPVNSDCEESESLHSPSQVSTESEPERDQDGLQLIGISKVINQQQESNASSNCGCETYPCVHVVVKMENSSRGELAVEQVLQLGTSRNVEVRRLRIDLLRSSYEGVPHHKCGDMISKLRKRVINLNLQLDKKKSKLSELTNSKAYLDNGVSSGLLKLMEKLQEEKMKLMMDLERKSLELSKCIELGQVLQEKLEKQEEEAKKQPLVSVTQQSNPEICGMKLEDLQLMIKGLETQLEEMETKYKESQVGMNLRMENLNDKVSQLEKENEVLRKENEANRLNSIGNNRVGGPGSGSPKNNYWNNRNNNNNNNTNKSTSTFRKYPSHDLLPNNAKTNNQNNDNNVHRNGNVGSGSYNGGSGGIINFRNHNNNGKHGYGYGNENDPYASYDNVWINPNLRSMRNY